MTHDAVCANCRKRKGEHKAGTLSCPIGSKSRIGYTLFAKDKVYQPKAVKP